MNDTAPTLSKITRHNGIAGQVSYLVDVTYPGEDAARIEFIGSVYGGPVVMVTPGNPDGCVRHGPVTSWHVQPRVAYWSNGGHTRSHLNRHSRAGSRGTVTTDWS